MHPNKKPIVPGPVPPLYAVLQVNTDFSAVFPASSLLLSLPVVTNGGSLEILVTTSARSFALGSYRVWIRVDGIDVKGTAGLLAAYPRSNGASLLVTPNDLAFVGLSPFAPGPHVVEARIAVGAAGNVASFNCLAAPLEEHASLKVKEV